MREKLPGWRRTERFIACALEIRAAYLQRPFTIALPAKSYEEDVRIYPTRDPAQGPAPCSNYASGIRQWSSWHILLNRNGNLQNKEIA